MVAGESVGVLYDPLFTHIHKDWLTTDSTDAVRQVFSGHSRCTVKLQHQICTLRFIYSLTNEFPCLFQ